MAKPLSPAAQAILKASYEATRNPNWQTNFYTSYAAAALRAVAEHCKCDDGEGYWIYRPNILAIAAELEGE